MLLFILYFCSLPALMKIFYCFLFLLLFQCAVVGQLEFIPDTNIIVNYLPQYKREKEVEFRFS